MADSEQKKPLTKNQEKMKLKEELRWKNS